jgi:hypothetical protein
MTKLQQPEAKVTEVIRMLKCRNWRLQFKGGYNPEDF